MRVGSDEGFVYVALETKAFGGGAIPWDSLHLQLALDTYHPELGQTTLPFSGLSSEVGFEFLLDLCGPSNAQLMVTPEYNPFMPHVLATGGDTFGDHFRRPVFSRRRADGVFDSLYTLTNRPRYTRSGEFIPGSGVNVGRLSYGPSSENSLSDWFYDAAAGMLQLRLPWNMLNVSDPSTARILMESDTTAALRPKAERCPPCSELIGVPSDGFRLAAVAMRPGPQLSGSIPATTDLGRLAAKSFTTWRWATWEEPTWHEYVKPVYAALRQLWSGWDK
jgi:hypothetical protein